jgi:acyl carrier protein
MTEERQQRHEDLVTFLRTIQKPNSPVESLGLNDSLVDSGLIDSLDTLRIVEYLETTYSINFSFKGIDPQQLSSIAGILDLIEESHK